MSHHSFRKATAAIALACLVQSAASAAVFTDPAGDATAGTANPYLDITSLAVTNDATNVNFTLNLASNATLTTGAQYGQYEVELRTGPGGQTLINANFGTTPANGNPYGTSVGSSGGVNYFIGIYFSNGTTPATAGSTVYSFNAATGWTQLSSQPVATTATSLSFSVTLATLGLANGSKFNVDAFSTFSGANGAYDALSSPTTVPGPLFTSGTTPPANYDSTTGSAYANDVFTVAVSVPEPAALAVIAFAGLGGAPRRRR